jgi:hypothetical protein
LEPQLRSLTLIRCVAWLGFRVLILGWMDWDALISCRTLIVNYRIVALSETLR